MSVVSCGGCGETDSGKRCLGCRHDFGDGYDPVGALDIAADVVEVLGALVAGGEEL